MAKTIPHVIYYFWQKNKPLTPLGVKCISSWRRFFPDYDIVQIDESNFDVLQCDYSKVAWEAKRYAYLSDYARVKTIFENGGIYFDLDVEIIKDIRPMIEKGPFFGLSYSEPFVYNVNTGLGFAAEKGNCFLKLLVEQYENWKGDHFYDDRNFPILPGCPMLNWPVFSQRGVIKENKCQVVDGTTFYNTDFFEPLNFVDRVLQINIQSCAIHWYNDKNDYIKGDAFVYSYRSRVSKMLKRKPSDFELKLFLYCFHPLRAFEYRKAHKRK